LEKFGFIVGYLQLIFIYLFMYLILDSSSG